MEQWLNVEKILERLSSEGISLGLSILQALLVFAVGHFAIGFIRKIVKKVMDKREIDPSVRSFVLSLVNITLTVMLIIAVIGALGIQTTSLAALVASVGVAVGMALSGNLSNFAGGLIVLLFRPYRVGDYIEVLGKEGTVREIQIFHTVMVLTDNRVLYIPNGQLSSGTVTNYTGINRRVDWVVGVEYGTDFRKVEEVSRKILGSEGRLLETPAPQVRINGMGDSSVNILVRAWVKQRDYLEVSYDMNLALYEGYNAAGISFAFPSVTLYQSKG
ncbi:MAG: mechanosensitive ion channel [Tannerellaceae bacterium]|jgi:small conductance mechanosensitive channel|nr:mechanosensitive ion channel [Tannerellaceae bacterium]